MFCKEHFFYGHSYLKTWVKVQCDFSFTVCLQACFEIRVFAFTLPKLKGIFVTMPVHLKSQSIKYYSSLMCWNVWGILLLCLVFLVLTYGQILPSESLALQLYLMLALLVYGKIFFAIAFDEVFRILSLSKHAYLKQMVSQPLLTQKLPDAKARLILFTWNITHCTRFECDFLSHHFSHRNTNFSVMHSMNPRFTASFFMKVETQLIHFETCYVKITTKICFKFTLSV